MGETSASIRKRVQAACNVQQQRFVSSQSDTHVGERRRFCKLLDEGQSLMRTAIMQLNLSVCSNHRTRSVKLARTIADLAGSEDIQSAHLAEALQYRPKIMMG